MNDEDQREIAHYKTKWANEAMRYNGMSFRCLALEDKLTKLLDLIEGEKVVSAQFVKESRFLLRAK